MKKFVDWGIFVVFVFGLWYVAAPTSFGGDTNFVIVDGPSMQPTYENGDLVVTRSRSEYAVGDVITYDAPVDEQFRVIHRITSIEDGGFVTQGDNRDRVDGWVVPREAVHGSSWLHIPHAGKAAVLLRQPTVLIGLVAGWLTLVLFGWRERRRDDQPVAAEQEGGHPSGSPPVRDRTARAATFALFGGMAVLGLASGFLVANAASLTVTADTLQVFADESSPRTDLTPPADPSTSTDTTRTPEPETRATIEEPSRAGPSVTRRGSTASAIDGKLSEALATDPVPAPSDDHLTWTFDGDPADDSASP